MKRKTVLMLIVLAISVLCCGLLFGCGGDTPEAPEVTNVSITAEGEGYGKAGALHKVTYTAPEGCEISSSVALGETPATAADYEYRDGGYIFYTAGEYTVTVYAAKDGMLGSGSAKVAISASEAFIGDVRIVAAAGETYGKAGALHLLKYTASAGSEIGVSVEKEDEEAADAVFDGALNTLIFGSAGNYTVTVTAKLGASSAEGKAEIEIEAPAAPTVSLSLGKRSVKEDEAVTMTYTADYAAGDAAAAERLYVQYRRGSSGNYSDADEDSYTVLGEQFIPHVAGSWKLTYRVEGENGETGEASAELRCTAAEIELSTDAAGRYRIQTGQGTEIGYRVEGAAEKYNVTFDTHGAEHVQAEQGEGCSVRVTAEEPDYFTVTVIYTHKVTTTIQKTLDFTFYSVDNLTYAPVWGEDPFGGMPSDVLTSMGHLLYFDASYCSYSGQREPAARDARFEVIENNVTASVGSNGVEVLYGAGENKDYPYVIVTNFDHNVATGNFTLKMTLTDPFTGYCAVATKTFNVLATTNDNAAAAAFIQNYVEQHSDFYDMGDIDYNKLCSDCRHNMVLTKTGTIMQRSNPDWALNNNGAANADFAIMNFAEASANCSLEFTFQLLAPNPVSNNVWLGIGLRTGNQNGWAGYFDLHNVGENLVLTSGLSAAKSESLSGAELPSLSSAAAVRIRIDRRTSGALAEYFVYFTTAGSEDYQLYGRWVYDVSTSAGNPGASVAAFQFSHRNAGGCYLVQDVATSSFAE